MTTNNNPTTPVSFDAFAVGRSSSAAFLTAFETRNPNSNDINYPIQQRWFNTVNESEWILTGYNIQSEVRTAIWQPVSASAIAVAETLTGNSGGAVGVDGSNNINVIGDGTSVNVVGNPATHTLTISAVTGTVITETLTGNSGGAVGPTAGNINMVGDGTTINIAGNPGTHTLTASAGATVATTYTENTGTATPALNNLNILGSGGVSTSGAGSTVTITVTGGPPVIMVAEQIFTSSGTYTPTAKMLYCMIEAGGGGGGGGGTGDTAGGAAAAGGGGGGGGYSRTIVNASSVGASQTVTIGAAGGGGASGNNAGGNGGTTSVGALCTANGGTGGSGNPGNAAVTGGAGASAGTGSLALVGQAGGPGTVNSTSGASTYTGLGGNSFFGSGAPGIAVAASQTGPAGVNYGAGGGGGLSYNASGAAAGGAGTKGIVVITEYIGG